MTNAIGYQKVNIAARKLMHIFQQTPHGQYVKSHPSFHLSLINTFLVT